MRKGLINVLHGVFLIVFAGNVNGQADEVIVAPQIQRFIGDVSDLEREKFFNMHGTWSDKSISADEYLDYTERLKGNYGRGFWGPFSWAKNQAGGEVGVYPEDEQTIINKGNNQINYNQQQDTWSRRSSRHIVVEHPANVVRWSVDKESAATWAAEYFKHFYTNEDLPLWFEPMNEPFVHANDDVFTEEQLDNDLMRQRMAEWFGAIGKKFDETPELENVNVIGYSAAWPSMELWDFGHWDSRMKMFMDIAGPHMDAFATHLYDGINVKGSDTKRSGSNSEAILDLIESYSFLKWGVVKPHAISEFGGIEDGYGAEYSDAKSVQSVKSINHILFNLLDRANDLQIAIPFITPKATWHINAANNYQPYGAVLWRPKELGQPIDSNTEWVYTPRVHFYELWNNVAGKRVYTYSKNPDIQTHAFVDGNKLFVALNNLDETSRDVNLNFANELEGFNSIRVKRLKIYDEAAPEFIDQTYNQTLDQLTLISGETVMLEYTFDQVLTFGNAIHYQKYYASSYLQQISGPLTFHFADVEAGSSSGNAFLRLSVGRAHSLSKHPSVEINGNVVTVPENWAGYDQANRDNFFGMIRIPVPFNYLKDGVNTVSVTFPDVGGHVSSLVLEVGQFEKETDLSAGKGVGYEVTVSPTIVDGYLKVAWPQVGLFNKLEIFNSKGSNVFSHRFSRARNQVSLRNLDLGQGVFILRLSGPGSALFTQKLVGK